MRMSSRVVWLSFTDQVVCWTLIVCGLAWLLYDRYGDRSVQGLARTEDSRTAHAPPFLVDVNRASWPELALLPGIGPTLAKRIVAERVQHGPFHHADDLTRVHGIGRHKLSQIHRYLLFQPPGSDPPSHRQSPPHQHQSIARSSEGAE